MKVDELRRKAAQVRRSRIVKSALAFAYVGPIAFGGFDLQTEPSLMLRASGWALHLLSGGALLFALYHLLCVFAARESLSKAEFYLSQHPGASEAEIQAAAPGAIGPPR